MSNPFQEADGPQPPRQLKAALEILANLRPLVDNHIPLTLRFHERAQRYQTFLLQLDNATLLLDELVPNDGERFLSNGEPFAIEAYYEGVRLSWETEDPVGATELDGVPCYRVALPAELTYHQRRNAYRALLKGSGEIAATLSGKRLAVELKGRLADISATGCKLVLGGDQRNGLQPGEVYDFVAMLPIGRIETKIELRHAHHDERSDLTHCGIRFHGMNGLLQRQVERFVFQLQREARRYQGGDEGRFSR